MYDTILVPTDGSDGAGRAVELSIALAQRFDSDIHAIHVLELGGLPDRVRTEADADIARYGEQTLVEISEKADAAGVPVTTETLDRSEAVHRVIVDYAEEHGADLVVMGTQGRTGLDRLLLGSTTERTLRNAPMPVLTVRADATVDPEFETILIPVDGSDGARAAAEHGIELASRTAGALHAVNVVDVTGFVGDIDSAAIYDALEEAGKRAIDDVVDSASSADIETVEGSILNGTPAQAILEYADEVDADLVVMGTHGRIGIGRLFLGSVTETVVRLSSVPVLGIKAHPEEGADGTD